MSDEMVETELSRAEPDGVAVVEDEVADAEPERFDALHASPTGASDGGRDLDPVPPDVPYRRWLVQLAPREYHPYFWDYSSWVPGRQVRPATDQTASIDIQFYCEMYLAAEIDRKILRLTATGNGFSVGKMRKNDWAERGVFQDECSLAFGPVGNHPLRLGGNSPENQNSGATYSSTTSFDVSAKAKSDGSGEAGASYKVGNSVTAPLSDFQVVNESGAAGVQWRWSMSQMGDGNARYTFPYSHPQSLATYVGRTSARSPRLRAVACFRRARRTGMRRGTSRERSRSASRQRSPLPMWSPIALRDTSASSIRTPPRSSALNTAFRSTNLCGSLPPRARGVGSGERRLDASSGSARAGARRKPAAPVLSRAALGPRTFRPLPSLLSPYMNRRRPDRHIGAGVCKKFFRDPSRAGSRGRGPQWCRPWRS